MEVYKRKRSPFYWYDFKLPGQPRQRGSTHETNETRAKKVAALKLAEALEGVEAPADHASLHGSLINREATSRQVLAGV